MQKLNKFLAFLDVAVKFVAIAMVVGETIEFFNSRVREKLGEINKSEETEKTAV